MRPFAENEFFAIWRFGADQSGDVVLDKKSGRWTAGRAHLAGIEGLDDETRQAHLTALARELGLETTDGSPAAEPEGPAFGM